MTCRPDQCKRFRYASAKLSAGAGASGFTLIELMIVLAIVATFLTLALPSFSGVARANRATTGANALLTAMTLARTEAITRRTRVSVCPGIGAACAGTDWNSGWIVFVDRQSPGMDSGDEVLRVWPAVAQGDRLVGDNGLVSFRPDGFADAAARWVLTPGGCQQRQRRSVRLVAAGHTTVGQETCS